jgi:hypothetical protein
MIGMLHYEQQCRTVERDGAGLGRVSVRRIECHGKQHAAGEAARKRKVDSSGGGGGAAAKKKRTMEHVHIPLLCEVMSCIIREMFSNPSPMRSLSILIALGGNDFCRNTPRIGPHRMWELLPLVVRKLPEELGGKLNLFASGERGAVGESERVAEPAWQHVDEDVVCDVLLSRLYAEVFSRHACDRSGKAVWDQKTFESLMKTLRSKECKLSEGVKKDFPSLEMIATTVRNASWNLIYWLCAVRGSMRECPSPVDTRYGYARDASGKPQWLDVVLLQNAGED